jgi:hypothetical protein
VPVGLRETWRRLGCPGEDVELRLWIERAADVPAGRDEQIDWLFAWWRTIDAWIDERHRAAGGAPPGDPAA